MGVAETEQMERPADGASVDRLPEPIQYKHWMFEHGVHHLSQSIVGKLAKPSVPATLKTANLPKIITRALARREYGENVTPPSLQNSRADMKSRRSCFPTTIPHGFPASDEKNQRRADRNTM